MVRGRKLDLSTVYLDDGFFTGDLEVVAEALKMVEEHAAVFGLNLKVSKSKLILPVPLPII